MHRRTSFEILPWLLASGLLVVLVGMNAPQAARAQAPTTDTPAAPTDGAYITNTFEDPVKVRLGPSTTVYPTPCGYLPVGATATALGTTPAHEWVQIQFAECPGGVGWVYAAYVTVTGFVRVVEVPPTPAPLATSTIDPTLAAAFQAEPTVTRLPTFTPPPPLAVPTFSDGGQAASRFPTGIVILGAAILGGLVLAASFMGRR